MEQDTATVREVRTLEWMYGEGDLAESEVFKGGFCNFGYWDSLPASASHQARAEASEALYRKLLDRLLPDRDRPSRVIEVGAGRGHGARLVLERYAAGHVVCVDQSAMQIERLRHYQKDLIDSGSLEGRVGAAEALPADTAAFDALYSVEALQHFLSNDAFLREAARILRPAGRLAITTFFATDACHLDALRRFIPTIDRGITRPVAIGTFAKDLERHGFVDVRTEAIGSAVFPGFDGWLEIIGQSAGERDSWGRNWLKCYQAGLIDYYLVDAMRRETLPGA